MSLWRGTTLIGAPLIDLYLTARASSGKEDPDRIKERRGHASLPRPSGQLVWIHAASVGESLSILSLVEALVAPPLNLNVLLTTGTVTSAKLMADRLPEGARHQYLPFDRPLYVRRFLEHWRPDVGAWVESELWPTLISEARAQGIPLALINGRMSKKSARGWQRWPGTARTLVNAFNVILAQDERTAERFRDLGASHARGIGNIKLAAAPLGCDEAALNALQDAIGGRPTWCAASIHAKEEHLILDAHKQLREQVPNALTIVAPRQPNRGDLIAGAATAAGIKVALRSAGEPIVHGTELYVADTIGEMGLFFRLASVAYMGRSLIDKGGSNPMEAPPLGCAVIAGPHTDNFGGIYDRLDVAGGVARIASADELSSRVSELLGDQRQCDMIAASALTLITQAHEVLDTTKDELVNLMQKAPYAAA